MKELREWKLNIESSKKNQRENNMEIRPRAWHIYLETPKGEKRNSGTELVY